MVDESLNELVQVAPQMNSLVKSSVAVVHYDMMAGALWWSDECPDFDKPEHYWCLRPLFRYRTTLILGEPDQRYEHFWEQAMRLFPAWPGFDAERCRADAQLAKLYRIKHRAGLLSFVLLDIVYRLQKGFNSRIPRRAIESRANRRELADITIGELHDLVCRYIRRSGKGVPDDSWDRVRHSVARATGADREKIVRETWLTGLLDIR